MKRYLLLWLVAWAGVAQADRLSLSWDHPMRDVVAYKVYCGADPVVRVTAPPYAFEKTGTWVGSCAVTALNAAEQESDKSQSTPEVRCIDGRCSLPPSCACLTVTPTSYIVAPNGTYASRPLYDCRRVALHDKRCGPARRCAL